MTAEQSLSLYFHKRNETGTDNLIQQGTENSAEPFPASGMSNGTAIKDMTRIGLSFYCSLKCVTSAECDLS